ncbi:MAG: hypothetical protein WCK02_11520 [Bacteroidota bacterium]
MKQKIFILIVFTLGIVSFSGCKTKSKISGSYTHKTECMGVELDGSQTLKAWGSGRNRADAIEQAYKNAIRDVLFTGILEGKTECSVKPLVPEVNAQEKYEDYFNKFFADGGTYKEFVSEKDGSKYHIEVVKQREKSGSQEMYGVVVRVLRAELKQKLKTDNILK